MLSGSGLSGLGDTVKYWRQPLDKDRISVPRGVVQLIAERCKGCGFCVEFCPKKILSMSSRTNAKGYHLPEISETSFCPNCGLCMLLCPDFAIYIKDGGEASPADTEDTRKNQEAS
jgi:2-oxoglutarate ferredoxin oxidoreductase subunit delta